MANPVSPCTYAGWSVAEVEADQALAAAAHTLAQADGLLNPALDGVFDRARPRMGARHVQTPAPPSRPGSASPPPLRVSRRE